MQRVAVLGVGAVGGLVAWHLARAGCNPTLVARGEAAARLRGEGLTLSEGAAGETVAVSVQCAAEAGPQDVVFLGLKAHHVGAALPDILAIAGPQTLVVPLLNGVPWWFLQGFAPHAPRPVESVDPEGRIAAAVNPRQVAGAVVYVASRRTGPTQIVWNRRRRFLLGRVQPGGADPTPAAALMRAAGLDASVVDDIRAAVWDKLLGNVGYNPISAIAEACMGEIAEEPGLRRVLELMLQEAAALRTALGVGGASDIAARMRPAPEMRRFRSSMLQDQDAGQELELGAIVGAVVELARGAGVPVPVIEAVGALAAARSRVRRGLTWEMV